VVEEEE